MADPGRRETAIWWRIFLVNRKALVDTERDKELTLQPIG